MSRRALVAGVGNVFFGDDGFGVEVARRLREVPLPEGVDVVDFGVRGIHLAYELLEPLELLVVVDVAPRGGEPGDLYVIDPEVDSPRAIGLADAHGMDLGAVFEAVRVMGGRLARVRIVACEPNDCGPGELLGAAVAGAVDPAVAWVRAIVETELGRTPALPRKEEVDVESQRSGAEGPG